MNEAIDECNINTQGNSLLGGRYDPHLSIFRHPQPRPHVTKFLTRPLYMVYVGSPWCVARARRNRRGLWDFRMLRTFRD